MATVNKASLRTEFDIVEGAPSIRCALGPTDRRAAPVRELSSLLMPVRATDGGVHGEGHHGQEQRHL